MATSAWQIPDDTLRTGNPLCFHSVLNHAETLRKEAEQGARVLGTDTLPFVPDPWSALIFGITQAQDSTRSPLAPPLRRPAQSQTSGPQDTSRLGCLPLLLHHACYSGAFQSVSLKIWTKTLRNITRIPKASTGPWEVGPCCPRPHVDQTFLLAECPTEDAGTQVDKDGAQLPGCYPGPGHSLSTLF